MSILREGQRVAYIGDGRDGLGEGEGVLLAITGSGGHVKWTSGAAASKITFTDLEHLAGASTQEPPAAGPQMPVEASGEFDPWDSSVTHGFSHEGVLDDEDDDDEWLFHA